MTTVESMFNKAKDMFEAAGRKAVDLTDLAKMKLKLADNERAIDTTLTALGRLLYESRKGVELNEETVTELIRQVDELEAANEELQASIDNNLGRRTCRSCGSANPESAAYCNKCGQKMD